MEIEKMTAYSSTSQKNERGTAAARIILPICSIALLSSVFVLSLLYPDKIAHSVRSGLELCHRVIVPSVFPFLVISDLLYRVCDFTSLNCIERFFEKFFKVNGSGFLPFALGCCCGFPLGVKCCVETYESGNISLDEAERLIGFCNNTGPAFVICGVGLGLRQDPIQGIVVYTSMIISAILVGVLFSIGKKPSCRYETKRNVTSFSLTNSIKNAGLGTVNICAYITFFACAVGLLRAFLGESLPYLFFICFIEIGSATSILSKTALISNLTSLAMTSFAIGFSGLSVHLQALSYLKGTDIKVSRYFMMKLLQGAVSAIITIPLYLFAKRIL
jgi:sporulation integral membrane protein YlbJ